VIGYKGVGFCTPSVNGHAAKAKGNTTVFGGGFVQEVVYMLGGVNGADSVSTSYEHRTTYTEPKGEKKKEEEQKSFSPTIGSLKKCWWVKEKKLC